MKNIYVIGSINTDLVINTPYMPKVGETLMGNGFFMAHGGKGANQAVAAARLGGKVKMCGCVGNDDFGFTAINALKTEGINVENIRKIDGMPTGTAVIIVENGDNRIILDKGANAGLRECDIDKALEHAEKWDIYITQLENPIEIIGYGLQKAKEKGMYVILNPAPANTGIEPYLSYCDLIIPNETELELFGGKEELLKKVKALLITLGGRGYAIMSKTRKEKYPCIKVQVRDTTAAGDTFCGGMVARLAEGKTLEESARFGSKAASIACTRKGAQPSIPFKKEVDCWTKNEVDLCK